MQKLEITEKVKYISHHYIDLLKKSIQQHNRFMESLSGRILLFKRHKRCGKLGLSNKDYRYIVEGILIVLATSYIFYENILAALVLSPYIYLHIKESRKIEENKQRLKTACEFKDGIMSVAFSLSVGYSIENSFAEAATQLKSLYGKDSGIVKEFETIVNKQAQNENLVDILDAYADKSNVEDIKYFVEVFRYAKRN